MNANFFIQLIQRLQAESPNFFKIIQWVAGILAIACGVLTWVFAHGLWAPSFADALKTVCSAAWPVLTGIFLTSKLPVKDQATYVK